MGTTTLSPPDETPASDAAYPHLRGLIAEHLGPAVRIRELRTSVTFSGPVYVADFDRGPEHFRTIGHFGPVGAVAEDCTKVIELSAMDLVCPERLVFRYERMLSLACGICVQPSSVLLLGVGGAAMWRFVRAYLPDCTTTLVDSDPEIIETARRWFYLTQPVAAEPAERFVAGTADKFDAILVDLYDSSGPSLLAAGFWSACLDALTPGGCLATNWADLGSGRVRPMAEAQAGAARARGYDCFFISGPGAGGNTVQYVATGKGQGPDTAGAAFARFAEAHSLSPEMRGVLDGCTISRDFPAPA